MPEEVPSLEKAIHHSESGDTILVYPGTYFLPPGGIHISQKNLRILGIAGAKKTILIGSGEASLIFFDQNCQATLEGFTITTNLTKDPLPPIQGGGIFCAPHSAPTIINNIIVNNKAQFGGGIYCAYSSSPSIIQNTISSNYSLVSGGGIFSFQASPKCIKNQIIGNRAGNSGGGIFCNMDKALIQNNIITKNRAKQTGGGCGLIDAHGQIVNNTFFGNSAVFGGGLFGVAGKFQILNTIFWKNQDDLCLVTIKWTLGLDFVIFRIEIT